MTAMRWADSTEGVRVALHDLGGKGAQVLLAHATGFAGRIWEPVTAHLQDGVLAALTLHRRYVFESLDAARQNFSAKDPFQSVTGPSLEAYLQHCFRPLEPNDQPGPDRQPAAGAAAITLACPRQDESELHRLGRYHGLFERLCEITCPVVIASGAGQPGTPSHFAPAVAAALDLSRFLQYPDLGHFGPQQDPARIAADIGEAWRSPPTRKQPT